MIGKQSNSEGNFGFNTPNPLAIIAFFLFLYLWFIYFDESIKWVIYASIIGAALGCFTGLVPGIHANTIAIILFSMTLLIEDFTSEFNLPVEVKYLIVVAIASTSISHTFLNFIPGTVMGAPEENNALGVLPMHEMVMRKEIFQCECGYIYYPDDHKKKGLIQNINFKKCPQCLISIEPSKKDIDEFGILEARSNLLDEDKFIKEEKEPHAFRVIEKAPGYLAIYYSAVGSLYAALFCILLIIPLKFLIGADLCQAFPILCGDQEIGYDLVKDKMLIILFLITLMLIFTDQSKLKRFKVRYQTKDENGNNIESNYEFYAFKEDIARFRLGTKNYKTLLGDPKNPGVDVPYGWLIARFAILTVFILSGIFGWIVLNQLEGLADSPVNPYLRKNFDLYLPTTTLFPAFTGLFGIATLLNSISTSPTYGDQNFGRREVGAKNIDAGNFDGEYYTINFLGFWHRFKKYKEDKNGNILEDENGEEIPTWRAWLIDLVRITKVPEFQCTKCTLYYGKIKCLKCDEFFNTGKTEGYVMCRNKKCGRLTIEAGPKEQLENEIFLKSKKGEAIGLYHGHLPKCSHSEDHKVKSIRPEYPLIGAGSGTIAGLLPGVTAGIGTILAMTLRNWYVSLRDIIGPLIGKKSETLIDEKIDYNQNELGPGRSEDTIMTLAAVNTAASLVILAGLFIILRPRNGTTIVINQMVGQDIEEWINEIPTLLLYLGIGILISTLIGFIFTSTFGVFFMKAIIRRKEDTNFAPKIMKIMIIGLILLVWLFTGTIGLGVLLIGTTIGLLAPLLGIRKSHCMGFLLIPVMIFYYDMSGLGLFT